MVEGSITVALVAFGGAEASTAYAVLLYRLISFWLILVIGWLFIGQLALQVRRGRWPRQALASEVEAGPEAYGPAPAPMPAAAGSESECRVTPAPVASLAALAAALVLAATLLVSCSAARTDLGTTDESCYLALPTAAKAVGGHGHLEGVRKYTLSGLRSMAPRLYRRLADDVPKKQAVCLVGYTGHFTASTCRKPLGRADRHAGRGGGDDAGEQAAGHADPDQDPGALPAHDPPVLSWGRQPSSRGSTPSGGRARRRSGRRSTVNEPRPPVSARRSTA